MSNDVTTSDGGARMTPPTNRRRALWVATGVAGLTGVVGLAALGGLAARNDKSGDAQRVGENHAAAPQNASDVGKNDENREGQDEQQNRADERDRDGKDRDVKDRDRDERGRVREVPCRNEELVEAIDRANREFGGTLKLARDCVYELSRFDEKSGTALPTIRQEIVIKGNGATIKRDSRDAFRLFRVADGGDLTLKDLTLKDGKAGRFEERKSDERGKDSKDGKEERGKENRRDEDDGGALLVEKGGAAHLKETELIRNNARGNGGAIANFGRVDVDDSSVENNNAEKNGGGIFNTGVLKVNGSRDDDGKGGRESHISNNTAGENGGGIANGKGREEKKEHGQNKKDGRDEDRDNRVGIVEIEKTEIEGNKADDNGGGLFSNGGFVKISFSTIKNNTACENGGGIFARNTDLNLHRVIVKNNKASQDGGGVYNVGGKEEKREVVLSDKDRENKDRENNEEGRATISDSEILDNTAGRFGGGIFNGKPIEKKMRPAMEADSQRDRDRDREERNATLTVRNSEIKGNTARNGGGIYNNKGKVTLIKTRVTKNTAIGGEDHDVRDMSDKKDRDRDRVAGGILNNDGKVKLDDESTVTNNDPTNCAGTVRDCFN